MDYRDLISDILILIFCFLFGAIPFCYLIAKYTKGKDLTKIGDKNPGGWNLLFNVSKWWGILGIILDVSKGALCYFLALKFSNMQITPVLAGCMAVAGHDYPPYLKFNGGKGVATTLGFLVALQPYSIFFYGFGIVTVLFTLKSMIWGMISAIICASVFLWIFNKSFNYLIMGLLLLIIIIPRYINSSKSFVQNFKIDRTVKVKDLFTPKIR
ncbi:MAG: glycerol-3-phosphate acyltransferase [Actinobacteria bacterium]|nr:glycerol-3-phosphate acyltransferase [Actinomycetota bacterium]